MLSMTSCVTDYVAPEPIHQRNDDGVVLNIQLKGSLQNPAFSPDGKSIILTRFINGYNQEPAEIFKYDLATEELTLLMSDGSGNVNLPGTAWNAMTNNIVFSSTRDPHDEIFMISENSIIGNEIQITSRLDSVAFEPTFNPNGEWIVFESHKLDEEGKGIITKYKIDGSSPYMNLTDIGDDCRQPNWSPDGSKVLYQKLEDEQWDIWIMDTDGSNKFKVTSGLGNNTDASFSNDGQYIIYSSDYLVDIASIYKISITGGTPVKLTNYKGYDGAPSLSSDGTTLIFESFNGEPDDSKGTKLVLLHQ